MNILLSAYACEPQKGSEPGVGWRWAMELGQMGHDVWVLTRRNNRPAIEAALARDPQPRLHFVYHDLPGWVLWLKKRGLPTHAYCYGWQFTAFLKARRLVRETAFDWVHHITFGGLRSVTFMPFLGLPFIYGPLGGGESVPHRLRRSFPPALILLSWLRDLSNLSLSFDPLMQAVFRRSRLILCKTPETRAWIPGRFQDKCRVQLEIGADWVASEPPAPSGRALRSLFIGRLLFWKGAHLALKSFAECLRQHPESTLTMIGSGEGEPHLRAMAARLGIEHAVRWVPWLPREEAMRAYQEHDVLLFPSAQDSSGNVVMEALANGLPVICLDRGGPSVIVDETCARLVSTEGKSEVEVVQALAATLIEWAEKPEVRRAYAANALRKARTYRWVDQVQSVYGPTLPARVRS